MSEGWRGVGEGGPHSVQSWTVPLLTVDFRTQGSSRGLRDEGEGRLGT